MKFKTSLVQEMRGRLGHTIDSGTLCFRTYKNFGIQVIKNPARIWPTKGKQWLYRHQIYYWSLHWNFLTDEQKAVYDQLAENLRMSGYDYYIRENQDPHHLYVHPSGLNWIWKRYPDSIRSPIESVSLSDDVIDEKHIYIKFPLAMISPDMAITAATLNFFYQDESGWDADDKRVDCRSITEDWNWNTLTWNNAPAVDPDIVDFVLMPGQMEWFDFDVTSAIQATVAYPYAWFGFHIRFKDLDPDTESMSGIRALSTYENNFWPVLELTI